MTSADRIILLQGDITTLSVDAIVNAAHSTLLGGGGVDGAIHRAAGPDLVKECATLGGCKVGEAKATKGYRLQAKWVIHTVGPVWRGGTQGEAEKLASCYQNSLALAVKLGANTVAFPAISCGVYGYPIREATRIAVREIGNFLASYSSLTQVDLVAFGKDVHDAYRAALEWYNSRHAVSEKTKAGPAEG